MSTCKHCGSEYAPSVRVVPAKPKTSRIGPSDLNYPQAPMRGSAPVQWLIDGEWVLKGWLLPQVG